MTDFLILEELQKIIKEIPRPRLLFKKGVTVKGFFRPYMSLSDYTKASIFHDADITTPVTVRFSSMLGDKGTADTRRNVKGMAVKFLPGDEVYDMICHNMPVNMINDKDKLIDMFRIFTVKDRFDGLNIERFWRYVLANNEALTFALMLYSGLGISDRFVDIKYYAVNTCIWLNNRGEEYMVRYKWMPIRDNKDDAGRNNRLLTSNTAEFIAGFDPDRACNGLINRIDMGSYPMFELHIQMAAIKCRDCSKYLDNTVIWDQKTAPYMCAGIMILDRNTSDEMNENICFFPGNIIDGISLPDDPVTEIFDFMAKTEALERGAYL